jgi:hypothetical protein
MDNLTLCQNSVSTSASGGSGVHQAILNTVWSSPGILGRSGPRKQAPAKESENHDMDMNQPAGLTVFTPILILGSLPLALAILLRAGGTLLAFMRPRVGWHVAESDGQTIGNVAQVRKAEEQVLKA